MKANIFDIQRGSFVDGPGIRTTVFFKGCNLRCEWCHNPESQNRGRELMFYADKCDGCGTCKRVCPNGLKTCELCGKCADYCSQDARKLVGEECETDEILTEILKDKEFYGSDGGVTFSGGECMLQIDALRELLVKCKAVGVHTAVDTAGCVPWEYFETVMPFTDLFLYDVKCFEGSLHESGTGVSNKLILDNLTRLSKNFGGKITVRIPVITGFNDSDAEMAKISDFLKKLNITDVELLPYHRLGESKYGALNRDCRDFDVPKKERMKELEELFG